MKLEERLFYHIPLQVTCLTQTDRQHLEQKIKVVNQGTGGGAQPSPSPTLSSAQDTALHRAASALPPCWKRTPQEGLRDCSQQVCMWLHGCGGQRGFICTTTATLLGQRAAPVPARFISTNSHYTHRPPRTSASK